MDERAGNRLLTVAALTGLAVLVGLGWLQRDRFAPVETGSPALDFALPALHGDTVSLASLRGRVVLLNVWATWCPPCIWEMPSMQRVHEALEAAGLAVVAVSVDARPGRTDDMGRPGGNVREFVEELELDFTVLLDPDRVIQRLYHVTGIPTTFVIDREGRIRQTVRGPVEWDQPPHVDFLRELLQPEP